MKDALALGGEEQAAISRGEGQIPIEPRISEWGNPPEAIPVSALCAEANPGN